MQITSTRAAMAGALVVGLSVSQAVADSVTFDFLGGNSNTPSLVFTSGALTLTATGRRTDSFNTSTGAFTGTAANVRRGPYGLGVDSDSGNNTRDYYVDGYGGNNETLVFDFDPKVTLNSIVFRFVDYSAFGDDDEFRLRIVNSLDPVQYVDSHVRVIADAPGSSQTINYDVASEIGWSVAQRTGLRFGLSATDHQDAWKVGQITVNYTPPREAPPVVPLPPAALAGGALMGAMGAGHLLRRSRKAPLE